MVHEVVGRINGQYGTLTHVPIYHLDRCAFIFCMFFLALFPFLRNVRYIT